MTALRAHGAAAAALVERDLRVFLSYRLRPFSLLFAPFMTVTLFYYISRLVKIQALGSSDGYFAYVVVGIVALDVLTSTVGVAPLTLRQELVAGTFEPLVLSPFGAVRSVTAIMAFPVLQAFVVSGATLVFAALVFGMPVAWPDVLLGVPAAVLGALSFAPFGVLTMACILVVKQALAGASILIATMSIFAGVYFPVRLLPDWIEWLSEVQPLTPALDLLRHLITGAPSADPALLDAAKLVGWTAVLLPASFATLIAAIGYSRRRGTITEY